MPGSPAYDLRPATPGDFALIKSIHHTALRDVVTQVWGWDEAKQDQLFTESFDHSRCSLIRCEERDIGLLEIVEKPGELFLSNILILPEHQGRGVGTRILLDLMERAAGRGVPVVLSVLRPNRAKRLYERLGFRVVAEDEVRFFMQIGRWKDEDCGLPAPSDQTS